MIISSCVREHAYTTQQAVANWFAYVKVKPASLYTLNTFSIAHTYAAVRKSNPRL